MKLQQKVIQLFVIPNLIQVTMYLHYDCTYLATVHIHNVQLHIQNSILLTKHVATIRHASIMVE